MSVPGTPSEQSPQPLQSPDLSSQDIISADSVVQSSHKLDDGGDGSPLPPALPPRPPPRPRQSQGAAALAQLAAADQLEELTPGLEQQIRARVLRRSCWLRKYVFLCTACGGLAVLLGALFLTVYFMLRSYTTSLNYFETVPTYVPAAMLIVTGLIVMCLAGRRNRYGYLIKLCGGCCLACAVLCVIVTITTTVIHMNRLQMLRECVYTRMTQTCTCYPVPIDSPSAARASSESIVHYVFNSTPDCEVIHGALYSCLRAMFGLSVIGILVCIFSCMLIYQLLSHEKKKMYWEQLEMRCRYLYRQQRNPHHCTCCDECRYPPPHQLFPWEVMDDSRYWTPGRVGNLYSPNPGEDTGAMALGAQRLRGQERSSSGWSWRRLPWSRGSSTNTGPNPDHSHREGPGTTVQNYRHATSSPDSQYGFSSHPAPVEGNAPAGSQVVEGSPNPYSIRDPHGGSVMAQPPGGYAGSRPMGPFVTEGSMKAIQPPQGYAQQYYMWGPPPPYSNPHSGNNSHCNSPARREPILSILQGHQAPSQNPNPGSPSRYQHYPHHHHMHHHHHHCQMNQQGAGRGAPLTLEDQSVMSGQVGLLKNMQRHRGGIRRFQDQRRFDEFSSSSGDGVINVSDNDKSVIVENYVNTSEAEMATSGDGNTTSENNTDSSAGKDRVSNTLPVRKAKKRIDISSVKSVSNIPFSAEHQTGSQKSSPSHFSNANNANGGNNSGSGGSGNGNAGFPRTNVQVLFGQPGCQISDHYHGSNHDDELSAEEAQLVAEKYPHSLPSSSALVRGKDGTVTATPSGNMSPRMRYIAHLQGVSNAAFQGQEGLELHEQQGQILCGKSEPTESEVYFADVSSCCNVSVRNDGQDSSLYDEALDPQKQRIMILNQGEIIPTSSSHIQRLPDSYQMGDKIHHHHRRLMQSEVMHPSSMAPPGHHQFQRIPMQEGMMIQDKGHQHHHRLISDGSALAISCDDQELTSNCFSYQRQSSTRNRLPFPLPHHHLSEQDSSTVDEDMQENLGRKYVVGSNSDFMDPENMRKMSVSNNGRSDIPKDPSQQSLAMSNNSVTPTADNNDVAFVSPMSISTSSPGSFPTEELENCGSYYDNHNNSSDVGSSGSTSAVCSPMSSSGNDVFGSPSHGYPSPQKIPYDQGPVLQQASRMHHMQQRNNNYHSPSHEAVPTEFVQLHGGDQHFLAPDAQYETIPQQQPQNPQAYQRHIHQQSFSPTQREDYNGNTPTNSPSKTNLASGRVVSMSASSAPHNMGGNVTSPARRRLNLPLHVTTAVSGNTNVITSSNNNSIVESLYHTATSTEEEESESHQPQSSNCYSDATMDSGCHSGSEFASRRRGGSARGGNNKEHSRSLGTRTEEDEHVEEVTVTAMRSVNV